MKKILAMTIVLLFSVQSRIFSQQQERIEFSESILEEGAETVILFEELNDELKEWAKKSYLLLEEVLKEIIKQPLNARKATLLRAIEKTVGDTQDEEHLLLMQNTLKRAYKFQKFVVGEDNLIIQHVLIPAIERAIDLYKDADLRFMEEEKVKQVTEEPLKPYARAAYAKSSIDYYLRVITLNKDYDQSLRLAKLATVWMANDLILSKSKNRTNPFLIQRLREQDKVLQEKLEKLSQLSTWEKIELINLASHTLQDVAKKIIPEEDVPQVLTVKESEQKNE